METWVSPRLAAVLAEVVDTAIELTGADFGNIQLLDREGKLRIVAQHHFPAWWVKYWEKVSREQGSCGTALSRGERVIIEDIELSPIFVGTPSIDIQRRAGIRAVQSTPLRDRSGQWLGMLSTHYRAPHRPAPKTLKLLDLLTAHAATLIEHARTEQLLLENEERFRGFFENVAIGTGLIDHVGRFIRVNDRYCTLTGYSREELLGGMGPLDLDFPDDRKEDRERLDCYLAGAVPSYEAEKRYLRKDGSVVWVHVSAASICDQNGKLRYSAGVIENITERKQAETMVLQERDRLSALINGITDEVWYADAEGCLTLTNPAVWKEFGASLGDSSEVAKIAARLEVYRLDGTPRPVDEAPPLRVLRGETVVDQEEIVRTPATGELRHRLVNSSAVRDAHGNIIGSVSVVRDITERKNIESQLAAKALLLELALSGAELGTWDVDLVSGRVLYDARYCAMLGHGIDEIEPTMEGWSRRVHPDDMRTVEEAMRAHLAGETRIYEVEYRQRHKEGHWIWVLTRGKATHDAADRPVRATGTTQNISDRKRVATEGVELLKKVEMLLAGLDRQSLQASNQSTPTPRATIRLSGRNREVLQLIAEGMTSIQIARELGIAEGTAASHRRNLMHKLGLKNKAEVIRYAIKHGLVADS